MKGMILLPKIKIKYSLNNMDKTLFGIKNDNKIIYKDDDYMVNLSFDHDKVILIRESDEIISEMHFSKKSSCKYQIKKYNKYVELNLELLKLNVSDNEVEINYKIEDEIINFKMHYEVI